MSKPLTEITDLLTGQAGFEMIYEFLQTLQDAVGTTRGSVELADSSSQALINLDLEEAYIAIATFIGGTGAGTFAVSIVNRRSAGDTYEQSIANNAAAWSVGDSGTGRIDLTSSSGGNTTFAYFFLKLDKAD